MYEFLKDFFTKKEAFTRAMRAIMFAVTAGALTPGAQEVLVAALGPYGALIVPILTAALGGGVAVGEKNETREGDATKPK